jgi:hypothetical protein
VALGGWPTLEECETRERGVLLSRERRGLGQPRPEFLQPRGGDPVLVPNRPLVGAVPPRGDEAAALETLQRRVDLREDGVPPEGGIRLQPGPQIPSARRGAGKKAEENVREGQGESISLFIYSGAKAPSASVKIARGKGGPAVREAGKK